MDPVLTEYDRQQGTGSLKFAQGAKQFQGL